MNKSVFFSAVGAVILLAATGCGGGGGITGFQETPTIVSVRSVYAPDGKNGVTVNGLPAFSDLPEGQGDPVDDIDGANLSTTLPILVYINGANLNNPDKNRRIYLGGITPVKNTMGCKDTSGNGTELSCRVLSEVETHVQAQANGQPIASSITVKIGDKYSNAYPVTLKP